MDPSEKNKIRASNIRAIWEALLAPQWTRNQLIELGKSVYARKPLKDLDPKLFDELLPRLVEIAAILDDKFTAPPPDPATTIPSEVFDSPTDRDQFEDRLHRVKPTTPPPPSKSAPATEPKGEGE